jgi:hypothetical protein
MKIIHRSTIKNVDGVIDIDICIVDDLKFKEYTYRLNSEYAARKFHSLYRKGYHGRAMVILNKFKIKEENHAGKTS